MKKKLNKLVEKFYKQYFIKREIFREKYHNKIHQFCNKRKDKIYDNLNDLSSTKWVSEIIKASVISGVTIIFLYLIRIFSPGDYDGVKLENYLEKNILKYIATENIKNQILYNDSYDVLSDDKAIFIYSKYTTLENKEEAINNYYDGVCLSIFERKEKSLLNQLLGTEPTYELVFCSNFEGAPLFLNYKNLSMLI